MISDTLNIDGVIYDVPDDKKREVERVNAEFQSKLRSMKLSDSPRANGFGFSEFDRRQRDTVESWKRTLVELLTEG